MRANMHSTECAYEQIFILWTNTQSKECAYEQINILQNILMGKYTFYGVCL